MNRDLDFTAELSDPEVPVRVPAALRERVRARLRETGALTSDLADEIPLREAEDEEWLEFVAGLNDEERKLLKMFVLFVRWRAGLAARVG